MATVTTESYYPRLSKLYESPESLPKRDFLKRLYEESTLKCKELLPYNQNQNIKTCQKDMMIASSCVLLKKANINIGDMRDSLGDCFFEIELAQKSLLKTYENFPLKKMDKWLFDLSFSIDPFVRSEY